MSGAAQCTGVHHDLRPHDWPRHLHPPFCRPGVAAFSARDAGPAGGRARYRLHRHPGRQKHHLATGCARLGREQLQISIESNMVRLQSVPDAPRQVQRTWELAGAVDAAASSAKLENGVLTLTLARVEPASKATTLSIH